jgi:hypothetical protein
MVEAKGAQPAGRLAADPAPIYSEDRVWDLPGFFWKRVTIQPGEMGLLIEKGQVQRSLHPGRHRVGWRFLGFGPMHRAVGRWRTGAFSLPLRFYRLGNDREEPLDAFTQATVAITDATRFYRVGVAGRRSLTPTQLGSAAAAQVQVIVDQLAAAFDPTALQRDPAAQEKLSGQVAPLLEEQLQDRGLRLERVYPLVFRPSKEGEALLEEALALQAELTSSGGKDWAEARRKVEAFASRALSIELSSSSEIDALRVAAGAPGTSDPGNLLVGFVQRSVDRLTGQVSERAQRLPAQKSQPAPVAFPYNVSLAWLNTLVGWVILGAVVIAVAVAGPIYPLLKGQIKLDPRLYFGGSYAILFVLISTAQFCRWTIDQWEKWRQKQMARAAVSSTWLAKWLIRDAAQVDEAVRHQTATELEAGPLDDLREAVRLCHTRGRQQEAQEARRLSDQLGYLATAIRGAEYASTALAVDGQQAVQQGSRLVAFEEESLRLARIIAARAREVKSHAQGQASIGEHLIQVADAVDTLRQHFANRPGVVAGAPVPAFAASPQSK